MKRKNAKKFTGQARFDMITLEKGFDKANNPIELFVDLKDVFGIPYTVLTNDPETTCFFRHKKPAKKYFQELLDTCHEVSSNILVNQVPTEPIMITQEKYNQMWTALQAKQITETEWKEFCQAYLMQIMGEPEVKASLQRLKFRG